MELIFIFDDNGDDEDDEEEEDDKTTAAQPTVSAWLSSSPKPNNRSAKPDLALKSSMKDNTQPSGASLTPRVDPRIREQHSSKARASTSAALSMKNNVSNPSDSSVGTDTPAKSKARGRSGKSKEVRKMEMARLSPDLRQQVAAMQGRPVQNTWRRPERSDAGDMSRVGEARAVKGGRGRGGSKPDRGVGAGDGWKERSRWLMQQAKKHGDERVRDVYDWPVSGEVNDEE